MRQIYNFVLVILVLITSAVVSSTIIGYLFNAL